MSRLLKISEATSMAMHALALLADDDGRRLTGREMAEKLKASEHHLSKVMQRLVKAGLVKSVRGPGGGFSLNRDPVEIALIEIYQEFEGALDERPCLFDHRVCDNASCILGSMLHRVSEEVKSYLTGTRLSDLKDITLGEEKKK